MSRTQQFKDQGFDLTTSVLFTNQWRVRCSQCEAIVINGVPCHEHGCPNIVRNTNDDD